MQGIAVRLAGDAKLWHNGVGYGYTLPGGKGGSVMGMWVRKHSQHLLKSDV